MNQKSLRTIALLAAACFAGAVGAASLLSPAAATHQPADKVVAKGSTVEVFGPGAAVTLLSGTLRSTNPTDLLLSVTLECSIITQVTTTGDGDAQALGRIEVWVEIDGVPVSVDGADDGRVVFCDRVHRQTTSGFDDLNENDNTIGTYLATRTANAFNWASLNVGNGVHTITVRGTLTETATATAGDAALAEAAIGKRTLVVEPTKMANDATV